MKKTYLFLSVIVLYALSGFGQTISIPPNTYDESDFGDAIEITINASNIQSIIGDVTAVTIRIEYDKNILSYQGYNNLDATVQPYLQSVMPSGDGVVQFNIIDFDFTGFSFPEGLFTKLNFVFLGGESTINITDVEFLDLNDNDWNLDGGNIGTNFIFVNNSEISGFATLTSNPEGGVWNTTGAWTGEFGSLTEPGPGHNITVQSGGTITINSDAVANSITIESGGQLTQNSNELSLTGDFTIQSGGSFIQNGTLDIGGDILVQRYIEGGNWAQSNDGWHMLSSPMSNQAIANGFTTVDPSEYDFFGWDEAAQTWRNFKGANFTGWNGSNNFVPGRGYLVAYENTDTKTFTGTLNSADVSIPVVRGGSDVYVGYNLVGNPYPSALTWGTDWTLGDIGAVAHVWNRATKAYVELNAGDPIPAMNGFMVYLSNAATNSLTIPAAKRIHGGTNWYKNTDERIVLVAHDPADGSAQRTVIRFDANATEDFDLAHDGFFLQGYAPKFYSVSNDLMFSVNTLPQLDPEMQIPLGFEKTTSENFYIELAESLSNEQVYLTDLQTNNTVILNVGGQYAFTASEGDITERFLIHFNPVGNMELTQAKPKVYAHANKLIVFDLENRSLLEVYNALGQCIYSTQTAGLGSEEFGINVPEGVYVVRLSNGDETMSTKVYLQD